MVAAVAFESRLDEISRLKRELDAAEATWLAIVGEYAVSGEWQADGYLSAAAALRDRCRVSDAAAHATVDLARKLEVLTDTAEAMQAGEISREHASAIARKCTPARMEMMRSVESQLVDFARISDPRELRGAVRRITDAFDGDGGASEDRREWDRNEVTFGVSSGRGLLNGGLDAESAEIVATALDAEMEAQRSDDDGRQAPDRRADALVGICRRYLASRDDGPGSRRGRTHLAIVANLSEIIGSNDELLALVRAEATHVGRLSRSTLERITCDCSISRVLTDGPSQILDVGRATRTVGTAMWNALVARDRHCTTPGCYRLPRDCEAHHIVHWSRSRKTCLENLKLKCWQHHRIDHLLDALGR